MLARRTLSALRPPSPRSRRGIAAVEFALILPVILGLSIATLEFGWYFSRLSQVAALTRDAARYGANASTSAEAMVDAQVAAQALLRDLGYDCAERGCNIRATLINAAGQPMVELRVDVEYIQLTGALPEKLGWISPSGMRARAAYPLVGII